MDKVNKTRSIAVDSNNKLVFPQISKLIAANPELGLPEQIIAEYGTVSINTTGNYQQWNILLEGDQTSIRGSSTSIRGYDEVSISALSTKIHGVEGVSIESDTDITFNNVINTKGIHERQLYKNQPQGSYEYKGWYLASKIRVPSMGLVEQESLAWNSWYNIDTYEFQVLLGNTQQEYNIINAIDPTTTYDENSTIANTLAVGDVLTLKNSSNYIDALKITKIEGNRITYKLVRDRLINYSTNLNRLVLLQSYQLNNPVNASIRCNAKPEAGPVVISGGATATNIGGGSNTTRGYLSTTIGGSCNTNSGDFTIVGGEDNIVSGKSSIIFGTENKCNQEINVVLGNQCQANYKNGSLLGYGLVTNHHNQTIIGQFNETMDSTVPHIENSIMLGTGTSDNERYTSIYAKRNQININAENLIWINSNNKVYINGLLTNIGKDNTFDNPGFTVGAGIGLLRSPLDNSNDTTSQVLVGRYNKHVGNGKVSGTPCFVVGNGTRSDRHNAIEVYSGKIDINNDVNINGNSTSDDAKSDSIVISNSNGITITPSSTSQIKNRVGNVHIDGTSISINPAGDSDDWGAALNIPELFECGNQLKLTNMGIDLYNVYNQLAATIDASGITGNKDDSYYGFTFSGTTLRLEGTRFSDYPNTTLSITNTGIVSYNKHIGITIGCNPDGGYDVSSGKLYYANIGSYELNGLLTSKTIYDYTNSNKVVTPSDYTETLLDKLTTTIIGQEFNPETEEYEYTYATGDTTNFDKTAVGLDYFYNVIKELNARIKELESASGSSTDPVDQIKLKINGTNEYCIVKAVKDANGAITLALE